MSTTSAQPVGAPWAIWRVAEAPFDNWSLKLGHSLVIGHWSLAARVFFDADPPILHLAAVAFQADGTGGRNFHRRFQELAVAQAVRLAVLHRHFDLVPIARPVVLELLI